jgi:apolipoprotein N-acyltransferase
MGAVAQGVSVIGMTGFTLLVVLWAGLPLAVLQRQRIATALALGLLLPGFFAFGYWRLAQTATEFEPGVALRIVQPNLSQDDKWRSDNARGIFDRYVSQSLAASPRRPGGITEVTHLIWPESAVRFLIDESDVAKAELERLLAGRTVLITGALRRDLARLDEDGEPAVHNSIITFDGQARVVARYDKWRLVPGGEFLPFEWLLKPLGFRKVVTVPGSFRAGPGPITQMVPGAPPAGLLVCYETIFPHGLVDLRQRPSWLINVTNDGWFGRSTGPYQHLAQARLRAIEQGLAVVRAANTGISAVVDPVGRIVEQLPLEAAGVIDSGLPRALPQTLYGRFGDAWLVMLCAASLLLALGLNYRQPRRTRPASLTV